MKKRRGITIRFGPLGLSLLAAGITAVGVAAVSLADSGGGSSASGGEAQTFQMPPPPGGAAGGRPMEPNLSTEDRQKLDEFRKCMEDNGAPAPPDPGMLDPGDGPPKAPSAADREKLQKALDACKGRLPERLRDAGPPGIGTFHCGPPPGAPPAQGDGGRPPGAPPVQDQQGQNQDQSNRSSAQSSGSAS